MIALPAWVTKHGVIATIKFVAVAALVALLIHAVKGVYDDQVAVRERIITETTARTVAERVVTLQAAEAKRREADLKAAREAMSNLNREFLVIKTTQQALLFKLRGVEADLDTKPMPEVQADANALMAEINTQLEATYR